MSNDSQGALAPIPFDFNSHPIRVVMRNGEPWFVAKDVCDALGYINSRDAIADHLDDDERSTVANSDSRNGGGRLTIINESGLYALVLRSRKPQARQFAKWVTSSVLPSIRKTGVYEAAPSLPGVTTTPDYLRAVNDAALDYVTQMWSYHKAHPDIPKLQMPSKTVLHGLVANMLGTGKFLVSFDLDYKMQIQHLGEHMHLVNGKDLSGAKKMVDSLDVHNIFRLNLLVTQRFFDLANDPQFKNGGGQ